MFHVVYRAAQGQQFAQAAGGGYLMDQFAATRASQASTAYPIEVPVGIIPQIDTIDFGASILSDVEPSSTGTPSFKVGRLSLALGVSSASGTASQPTFLVNRVRAGTAVVMGTFSLVATPFPTIWGPVHLTGGQISNGTLIAGDAIVCSIVSNGTGQVPLPAFIIQADVEG